MRRNKAIRQYTTQHIYDWWSLTLYIKILIIHKRTKFKTVLCRPMYNDLSLPLSWSSSLLQQSTEITTSVEVAMNPIFPPCCILLQSSSCPLSKKHVLVFWWQHIHTKATNIVWVDRLRCARLLSCRIVSSSRCIRIASSIIWNSGLRDLMPCTRNTCIGVSEARAAPSSGQPMRECVRHKMCLVILYKPGANTFHSDKYSTSLI